MKSKSRTTMLQKRSNSFLIITTEQDMAVKMNFEDFKNNIKNKIMLVLYNYSFYILIYRFCKCESCDVSVKCNILLKFVNLNIN